MDEPKSFKSKRKRSKATYWQSAELNQRWYEHYYDLLTDIALNRYKWIGLPETVDERYLELCLHRTGAAVIFKPWFTKKLMVTGVSPGGCWNINDNPTEFVSYGNNGWNYKLGLDQGVIVWASRSRGTMHNTMMLYARDLADMERTAEINIRAQKTPTMILCPETQKQPLINMYKQYNGNEPLIMGNKSMLDVTQWTTLKTDAPYVADKIMIDLERKWRRALTVMGIDNANTEKRERQIVDEVTANNGEVELMRLIGLNARREACKKIEQLYGIECTVVWNHDNMSQNYNFTNNIPMMRGAEGAML